MLSTVFIPVKAMGRAEARTTNEEKPLLATGFTSKTTAGKIRVERTAREVTEKALLSTGFTPVIRVKRSIPTTDNGERAFMTAIGRGRGEEQDPILTKYACDQGLCVKRRWGLL